MLVELDRVVDRFVLTVAPTAGEPRVGRGWLRRWLAYAPGRRRARLDADPDFGRRSRRRARRRDGARHRLVSHGRRRDGLGLQVSAAQPAASFRPDVPHASQALPGFRDFYPARVRASARTSSATWRDVARRYGFVEYDGPPLEPLELYTKKSGDEIVGQLYNFTDKGGREVALRPEMTPTLARMVAARANALRKPIRWFSMPQLFRYERQQTGRLREHFQLNVDIIGEAGPLARRRAPRGRDRHHARRSGSAPATCARGVSDRRLLDALLRGARRRRGAARPAVFAAIDKIERRAARRLGGEARGGGRVAAAHRAVFELAALEGCSTQSIGARSRRRRSRGDRALRRVLSMRSRRMGARRVRRARPLDRARARLLHGHRLRAVRRAGRAPRDLRRRPLRRPARSRSAAWICRRSASAWATWCSASCCAIAGLHAARPAARRPSPGSRPTTTRGCPSVLASRRRLRDARTRSVEYALSAQARRQAAQGGAMPRGVSERAPSLIGPRRHGRRTAK